MQEVNNIVQSYTAGYGAYVNYGYEATYGTTATTKTRVFGAGQKITLTRRNNMERIYGLGFRNATANVALKYEGAASVEYILTNATWLRALLGAVADGGLGPSYTHTYAEANTLPSFTIATGTELGSNDEVTELLGCKIGSMTMTATQGEIVRIRLECPYKTETLATTGISSQFTEAYTPFTFAQGLVEWSAGGGEIGKVQSIEWTINNDIEGLWGLNSRFKANAVEKRREYNLRLTIAFKDVTELLTKFFGASGGPSTGNPAAQANIVLTFDTGGAGSSSNKIVMTIANVYFDEETLPKDVNEIIKEDVSGWSLSTSANANIAVWTNGTSIDNAIP
jgi:hypothetical protein